MVRLLGYESFEELKAAIKGLVVNTIHPEDRRRVAEDIGEYSPGVEYTTTYRMPKEMGPGSGHWIREKSYAQRMEDWRSSVRVRTFQRQ